MSETVSNHASAWLAFIHEGRRIQARKFTSVTSYPQLTMAWHMTQRHARGNACVKRGRSSTQFVRWLSERVVRKETVALMWNSQRQLTGDAPSDLPGSTALRLSSADSWYGRWSDCHRRCQTDSLAIAELGWAWSRVLHDVSDIGQNLYRSDSMMIRMHHHVRLWPETAFLFFGRGRDCLPFPTTKVTSTKGKNIACHRMSAFATSHVNPTT